MIKTDNWVETTLERVHTDGYVGGTWRPSASGTTFEVVDPTTELVVAKVSDFGPDDAIVAVDAAATALAQWSRTAPRVRSEILRRSYELMMEQSDAIARLIVLENGKAYRDAASEVAYAAEFFRWYAEEAVRSVGEISLAPSGSNRIIVGHRPIGVALLVTPWNFPAAMLTRKIAPALAAGCTVVCKPAPETPLTALLIARILEDAGLPAGVVNVVPTERAAEVVTAILRDGRVRKLSFTGSTEVGRLLLGQAAEKVVNCSMELGGNAPFIVFDDADLDAAIAGAMIAKMRNGGEACTAANRFLCQERIAGAFSERLTAAMSSVRMGSGMEDDVEVGPLINSDSRAKVHRLVSAAVATGATSLTGGYLPKGRGYFYPPTVLANVKPGSDLLGQEIFGPIAPISTFATESEAIELANDTEYGLVSYVYTSDLARGLRVAEALETGMVGLNRGVVSDPAAPFGGAKQSGLGREGGHHGLLEFLEPQYIACSW